MDLNDVTAENYFKKVTYASDAMPGTKLVIPDGDFVLGAINLRLILAIENLVQRLEKLRQKLNG